MLSCSRQAYADYYNGTEDFTDALADISMLFFCFPVEQFYEFGPEHNDITFPQYDDHSIYFPISANFLFFGYDHSQVYVNSNGGISTNDYDSSYSNTNVNNGGLRRILPFYSDIDTNKGGDIWYRQTTDNVLLQRATSEVRMAFPWHSSFTATWMFLTTWHNVNSYSVEEFNRNTFQAVLVTNEVSSFIIFLYDRTEWANSTGRVGMAGYTAGDGVNFLIFPESGNETEMLSLSMRSNIGIPGMFIFDVGGLTIAPAPVASIECPEISITNGIVEYIPDRSIGGALNVMCDVGFTLIGENGIVCNSDGIWEGETPVCEANRCTLQEIRHGYITGENHYGGSITYGCYPGYAMVCGDEIMACGADGLWNGTVPYCIWRGKSNVLSRDFKGKVDENQGNFCKKLRDRNGDFGQRPE